MFVESRKTIFLSSFCDEFNISFSKQWSNQKSNHYIRNLRSNLYFFEWIEIIYFLRESFKILIKLLANWSFSFIHSINSISRLEVLNFLFTTSTLKPFYLLKIWFEKSFINSCKSIFLFCLSDNINISIRKSINSSTEFLILTVSYQYLNHF